MQAVPSAVCCRSGQEEVLGNEMTHHSHVRKISVCYYYYFFFPDSKFCMVYREKKEKLFPTHCLLPFLVYETNKHIFCLPQNTCLVFCKQVNPSY